MNFYYQHQDLIIFLVGIFLATTGYWLGNEMGYSRGLEDGFKDGVIEGEKH